MSSWTPGTDLPVRNRVRSIPPRAWISLLACVLLGGIGVLRWPREAPRVARTILFGTPLLFLLLLFISERFSLPIWIVGRTDSVALPAALLGVAAGLATLPPRRALLAGVLLAKGRGPPKGAGTPQEVTQRLAMRVLQRLADLLGSVNRLDGLETYGIADTETAWRLSATFHG